MSDDNNKFKNGKIYTIRYRNDENLIYVGSTVQPLYKRFSQHKKDSINTRCENMLLYIKMNETDINDWYIELLEDCPCERKEQLTQREGQIIRDIATLNKNIAGRTKKEYREKNKEYYKEYDKEYYHNNKEHILEKAKEYRNNDNNKDKINEYDKEYKKDNREQILEQKKEYYLKNKDNIAEQKKEYYKANKDILKEKDKKYREENKDKINERRRDNYLKKKLEKEEANIVNIS